MRVAHDWAPGVARYEGFPSYYDCIFKDPLVGSLGIGLDLSGVFTIHR